MKQTLEMDLIQENMKPGKITKDGFLGTDNRKLIDILIDDDAKVKRLGLDHKMIAEKMQYFKDKGLEGLGEFINVNDHFEVRVDTVRGKLPCPFKHKGLYRKTYIIVKNKKLNKEITYTDLLIHLISEHGFYEGKGSLFRLEPEDIAEILEIQPENE